MTNKEKVKRKKEKNISCHYITRNIIIALLKRER